MTAGLLLKTCCCAIGGDLQLPPGELCSGGGTMTYEVNEADRPGVSSVTLPNRLWIGFPDVHVVRFYNSDTHQTTSIYYTRKNAPSVNWRLYGPLLWIGSSEYPCNNIWQPGGGIETFGYPYHSMPTDPRPCWWHGVTSWISPGPTYHRDGVHWGHARVAGPTYGTPQSLVLPGLANNVTLNNNRWEDVTALEGIITMGMPEIVAAPTPETYDISGTGHYLNGFTFGDPGRTNYSGQLWYTDARMYAQTPDIFDLKDTFLPLFLAGSWEFPACRAEGTAGVVCAGGFDDPQMACGYVFDEGPPADYTGYINCSADGGNLPFVLGTVLGAAGPDPVYLWPTEEWTFSHTQQNGFTFSGTIRLTGSVAPPFGYVIETIFEPGNPYGLG